MTVTYYDLDIKVFSKLNEQNASIETWYSKASGIADYVASWGMHRFWAMSRSPLAPGGEITTKQEELSYFAWDVARRVLCEIVYSDLELDANSSTTDFHATFDGLDMNQQVMVTELLIEISEAIQFWSVRMKQVHDLNHKSPKSKVV